MIKMNNAKPSFFLKLTEDDGPITRDWADAALILSILLIVSGFWIANPRAFIADDSYFYLEIARNFASGKGLTFNEIYPTNGFHPLWACLLILWDKALLAVDPGVLKSVSHALPLPLVLLWSTALITWRVAKLQGLNPSILILPLVGYLGFFGHLYSEVHLYVYLLASLILLLALGKYQSKKDSYFFGLLIGLTFLSRLDLAFVLLGLVFTIWRRLGRRVNLTWVLTGAATPVLPYLVANVVFFDGLAPVSGWLKSSFPQIYPLVNFRGLTYSGGLSIDFLGYNVPIGLFPIIVGAFSFIILRSKPSFLAEFPAFLLFGTLLHFAYTSLFTRFATEWYWYYGSHQLLLAFSLAWLARKWQVSTRNLHILSLAIVIGVLGLNFYKRLGPEDQNADPLPAIRYMKEQGIKDQTIMVSDFPGRIAFDSGNHVIATDLLTGSRSLIRDMQASGNALNYLVTAAERKGRPVSYLFLLGGCEWLVPTSDFMTIAYNNPKYIPQVKEWGRLELGMPIYRDHDLAIWKLKGSTKYLPRIEP